MNTLEQPVEISTATAAPDMRRRMRSFVVVGLVILLAFALPLWHLILHALKTEIASHILLIPFISIYLWRLDGSRNASRLDIAGMNEKSSAGSRPSLLPIVISASCGLAAIAAYLIWGLTGRLAQNDALALSTLSLLCFLFAGALGTLGWPFLRRKKFALAFLLFAIPLPLFLLDALAVFLQFASAEVANVTLRLTGMPLFRDGLSFQMPGLRIFVAEECSGIRSTLVLLITSVLGSYLFLRRGWSRFWFVLAVIPIGIFRNALRITTISWLTVHVNSRVIDSPLHHRGGPLFFLVSLVPLFLLLWWLRRTERSREKLP